MATNRVFATASVNPAGRLAALTASYTNVLQFYLNGTRIRLDSFDPRTTLLDYLRSIGLSGTKRGCVSGGCGICTVVVSQYDQATRRICHLSVNACLTPMISIDGKHVITVEGIGDVQKPHPVQERIALFNGSQCGFCTPGIVMTLYALLRNQPYPSSSELEEAFVGNLCRCTGYRPILDAAQSFAGQCCRLRTNGLESSRLSDSGENLTENAFDQPKYIKYNPDTELIFPPPLMKHIRQPLAIGKEATKLYRPVTLHQLQEIMRADPFVRILAGNTEVRLSLDNTSKKSFVFVGDIAELRQYTLRVDHLEVGGNVTLSELENISKEALQFYGTARGQPFTAICNQLQYVGRQIKNAATIAGSLAAKLPDSDLNTILMAMNAVIAVRELDIEREIPVRSFLSKNLVTALPPLAIISNLRIPITEERGDFLCAYRHAKRKDGDSAMVNASLRVSLSNETYVVKDAMFCYGGTSLAHILSAENAAQYVLGRRWSNPETLEGSMDALQQDFAKPSSSVVDISAYNMSLVFGFFYRFYHEVLSKIPSRDQVTRVEEETINDVKRSISSGCKDEVDTLIRVKQDPSRPTFYASAIKNSTGQAQYIDDIPVRRGELHGCLVLSTKPRAKLMKVDVTAALNLSGVVDYVDYSDLPNKEANIWGPISDEIYMAVDEVFTVGQVIGMILATSPAQARSAAKQVRAVYEELPAILTLDEAISQQSYFEQYSTSIRKGDVEAGFAKADHIVSGISRIGGQEHFYMETQACLVIPKEDDEIEVWSGTQSPSETQGYIARICNLPMHKVVVKVKRLGGGFGGKGSRSAQIAAISAIAAKKLRRPVRCILSREEDMLSTGQRHPFLARWKVGVMANGKLVALDADVICKAGWSMDVSGSVCNHALWHIDNCYYFPNLHVQGRLARTNTMSNTAFRGFGAPQGMFITESFMTETADALGMPGEQLREINFYAESGHTHFGQSLKDWHIPLLYEQIQQKSDYVQRRLSIQEYNRAHKWKKRGLALIPTKFGVSFTALHLNQAGALVHIYDDGSVSLSHGGVEMGQGLHSKMAMIAAQTLNVPVSDVFISDTATNKVPNTSATAASVSSDLNGYAVLDACQQISARLAPYRALLRETATMKDLVSAAHKDRVNLSAIGHYKTPDLSAVWGEGRIFNYFTQGVAAAEVEIDCLTGGWTCLRADIMMDIGRSLDRALDYGQIEGAFIQGLGLFTLEEPLWSYSTGSLVTTGPSNYKIPGFRDIPQVMNISLLEESNGVSWKNLNTVQRSRGVGEPPLFLGSAVFFAIRNALENARQGVGVIERLSLDSPATVERIRMACRDEIVQRARSGPVAEGESALFSI